MRDASFVNGYLVTEILPYLDETYGNKIAQLDYFIQADLSETIGIFLLDLDMVVLSPLDVSDRRVVWGKVVEQAPGTPGDLGTDILRGKGSFSRHCALW